MKITTASQATPVAGPSNYGPLKTTTAASADPMLIPQKRKSTPIVVSNASSGTTTNSNSLLSVQSEGKGKARHFDEPTIVEDFEDEQAIENDSGFFDVTRPATKILKTGISPPQTILASSSSSTNSGNVVSYYQCWFDDKLFMLTFEPSRTLSMICTGS